MPKRVIKYPRWLKFCLATSVGLFIGLNLVFPVPVSSANNLSPVVKDHEGRWIAGFTVENGIWRVRADLTEIDPRFIRRLIAVEDKRFWNHSGVDIAAILRAGRSWRRVGKPVSGASTITMQLVRQIEPRPRTLSSKMIESFRALQYELWYSKSQILELYLSHVSYGGNIEGVHAASQIYFGKPPYQLTDAEIALLIALPQAPEARRPDLRPEAAKMGRDAILDKLVDKGVMTVTQAQEAKEEPLVARREAMPEMAWVTARGMTDDQSVTSTLDYDLQGETELLISHFVAPLDSEVNMAAIIVENKTMSVRAHIASADRNRPGGWIDMSDRARSPGSTLKPFIYGLAMDDGVVSSGSFVTDAPTRFGSYQPENFNRRYYGDVRIYEALRHSLNVPAVRVLDQVGGGRLETTLSAAGVNVTRLGSQSEQAGLALALGGAGITVNDLAVIYAALANGGIAQPLKWTDDDSGSSYRLLSENSAAEITQILRQSPTPDGRVPAWLTENSPPVAYKTGTSYGFRDAWAAGYTDEWTVIVWVGRPDGAPRNGQTGRIAAAPLLFDIFSNLPHGTVTSRYTKDNEAPSGLSRVADVSDFGPQIIFPPDGAELFANAFGAKARGFSLSARTRSGSVRFYVNGQAVAEENNRPVWRPASAGFYEVKAIDDEGRESVSQVEILSEAGLLSQ